MRKIIRAALLVMTVASPPVAQIKPFQRSAPFQGGFLECAVIRIIALVLVIAMLVAAPAASGKNMFYLLAAKWCDVGSSEPVRFEISDDGSLIYDPVHGRTCQISNATNMDQPSGTYNVTWRCETGVMKEKLFTTIEHDKQGNRHFLMKRNGKTYEQCRDQ